jgi:hypothetical protein
VDHRLLRLAEVLATLHPAWAGQTTFERGDRGDAGWCQAELLRLRGEQALEQDSEAAEALFLRSLEQARHDGALAWELRTATSLARLWREQGRGHEALDLLRPVLDQLTEGEATPDVKAAAALLDALARAVAPLPQAARLGPEPVGPVAAHSRPMNSRSTRANASACSTCGQCPAFSMVPIDGAAKRGRTPAAITSALTNGSAAPRTTSTGPP